MPKLHQTIALGSVALALFATGAALAGNPGHGRKPPTATDTTTTTTTTAATTTSASRRGRPGAAPPAALRAYGKYCKEESRKHVAGRAGTPFSLCVAAMAELASGTTTSWKTACAPLSKKHVRGRRSTPYGLCLWAAAQMRAHASNH